MKTIRGLVTLLALAGLAVTAGAGRARAQDFQGRFTLPFHAQWGKVKLQPGKYTLHLQAMANRVPIVVVSREDEGNHQTKLVGMAASNAVSTFDDEITLTCLAWGTTHFVRSLTIGPRSQTLYFQVPKGALLNARNADQNTDAQVEKINITPSTR
jgi:hypothetical protein